MKNVFQYIDGTTSLIAYNPLFYLLLINILEYSTVKGGKKCFLCTNVENPLLTWLPELMHALSCHMTHPGFKSSAVIPQGQHSLGVLERWRSRSPLRSGGIIPHHEAKTLMANEGEIVL